MSCRSKAEPATVAHIKIQFLAHEPSCSLPTIKTRERAKRSDFRSTVRDSIGVDKENASEFSREQKAKLLCDFIMLITRKIALMNCTFLWFWSERKKEREVHCCSLASQDSKAWHPIDISMLFYSFLINELNVYTEHDSWWSQKPDRIIE